MDLTPDKLPTLMEMLSGTREEELTCDECLTLVSEFAEIRLAGKAIPAALEAVSHHLRYCPECRDEYEALLRALDTLDLDE